MNKAKLLFMVIAIIVIIICGALLAKHLTRATPTELTTEEMNAVITMLEESVWVLDNDKRNKSFKELTYSKILSLEFGKQTSSYLPVAIITEDNLGLSAKVVKGETNLKLISSGTAVDIWYTENGEGSVKTLTLLGEENYLVFTLK